MPDPQVNLALSPINDTQPPENRDFHGRFVKGVSGNPGGRPKKISNALDRALTPRMIDKVARALIRTAAKGNVRAFDSLADRVEGKVPQALTGADGGPVEIAVAVIHVGSVAPDAKDQS